MDNRGFGLNTRSFIFSLIEKARANRLGDLRLLGLSVGILLLSVLLFIWDARTSPEDAATRGETKMEAVELESAQAEEAVIEERDSGLMTGKTGSAASTPTLLSPEEQEQALREMAEQMPEGEVIIY